MLCLLVALSEEADTAELPGVEIVDDVELPGVDAEPEPETLTPQNIEINDLEVHEPDPAPIDTGTIPTPTPEQQAVAEPVITESPRRSTRVRSKPSRIIPSMTGSKYAYAVTQLESQGVLNPDAHMFVQEDFYQAEPDVVAAIMTQLSLKVGLKEWGDKAFTAAHSEMKQLHL